jgi:hypothetical protein
VFLASPFLDFVRERMVFQRYAKRTIETYLYWIKFFILFHKKQHSPVYLAGSVKPDPQCVRYRKNLPQTAGHKTIAVGCR